MWEKFWPLFALLAIGLVSLMLLSPGCGEGNGGPKYEKFTQLEWDDVKVGTGDEVKVGDDIEVHYIGSLAENGKVFDSSRSRGQPFVVRNIGKASVIEGWNKGLIGMRVGGQRILKIPAAMAYGAKGAGEDIPPNADLIFDIELLGIVR